MSRADIFTVNNGYTSTVTSLVWPVIQNDLSYVAQYWYSLPVFLFFFVLIYVSGTTLDLTCGKKSQDPVFSQSMLNTELSLKEVRWQP